MRRALPSSEQVLSFGAIHNPKNWEKHLKRVPNSGALQLALRSAGSEAKFTRRQVFDLGRADPEAGAIASMIWGFPAGGPRGQYRGFVEAFGNIRDYVDVISAARNGKTAAVDVLQSMNALFKGVGFATTTKILYFAEIEFREGPALIFDANVIEAIIDVSGVWSAAFSNTREKLGSRYWYQRATQAYGSYLREARDAAASLSDKSNSLHPAQIETALFLEKVRPGIWK